MWPVIVACVSLAVLVMLVLRVREFPDLPTRFMIFALWARYVMSAFHDYTFPKIVAGFSINAVVAILITGTALYIIEKHFLRLRYVMILYFYVFLVILSGVLNQEFGGMLEFVMRYLYTIGLALLAYRAMLIYDPDRVLRALMIATAPPLVLQGFSLLTGTVKFSEHDGSFSYIGGYYHEAPFSMVLLSMLFLSALVRWKSPAVQPAMVVAAVLGIFLANYRTNIVATLPLIAYLSLRYASAAVGPSMRSAFLAAGATIAVLVLLNIGMLVPDRFDDVLRLAEQGPIFLEEPATFTRAQKDLFSYRIFLWSLYLHAWMDGDIFQVLIGLGPDAYSDRFSTHAHNTYFSILFELGIIGLATIIAIQLGLLVQALSIPDRDRAAMAAACLSGFLLSNLATLSMWQLEGLVNFAVMAAFIWRYQATNPVPLPGSAALVSRATP